MGRILRIGFPIAMQDGLIQVAFIIITIIANRRGLSDAAAVGIVEKIISFLFLVPSSMLFSCFQVIKRWYCLAVSIFVDISGTVFLPECILVSAVISVLMENQRFRLSIISFPSF